MKGASVANSGVCATTATDFSALFPRTPAKTPHLHLHPHPSCACGLCSATSFCWLCGKKIGDGLVPMHYMPYNLFGCPNLQMAADTQSTVQRIARMVRAVVIMLVILPVAAVLSLLSFVLCPCIAIPALRRVEGGVLGAVNMMLIMWMTIVGAALATLLSPVILLLTAVVLLLCLPCVLEGYLRRAGTVAPAPAEGEEALDVASDGPQETASTAAAASGLGALSAGTSAGPGTQEHDRASLQENAGPVATGVTEQLMLPLPGFGFVAVAMPHGQPVDLATVQ